jgi:hypothetical protein
VDATAGAFNVIAPEDEPASSNFVSANVNAPVMLCAVLMYATVPLAAWNVAVVVPAAAAALIVVVIADCNKHFHTTHPK